MNRARLLGAVLLLLAVVLLVILGLTKIHADREEALLCRSLHDSQNEVAEGCPLHGTHISWLLIIASGLTFLILGVGVYLVFFAETEPRQFRDVDVGKLDEEEKAVYGLLKANQGAMYQSDLGRETGFSKVKITRVLDRLSTRDIVERKRRGMTNLIVLK